jgi:signal transduction histidine kinase
MQTLKIFFIFIIILIWEQPPCFAIPDTNDLPATVKSDFDSLVNTIERQDFLTAFTYLNRLQSSNISNDATNWAMFKLREGQLYLGMQLFDKAEKCLLESVPLFEKTQQVARTGEAYYFLGGVMEHKKDDGQKQLNYFKKALPYYQKAHDTLRVIWTLDAIGASYYKLKLLDKAIENSRLAATLMMGDSTQFYEPNVFTSLGEYYLAGGDLETAQIYLEKSVNFYKNLYKNEFDTEGYLIYDAYRLLGAVYLKLDKRTEGMALLNEALNYCQQNIDDPLLVKETFAILIEDAKQRGDLVTALQLHERYNHLRDSLSQRDEILKLEQNQMAMAISKAEKEQALLKNQLSTNQTINQTMAFVAILMLGLLVALSSLYRQNRTFNKKLHLEVQRKTQALQQSNAELERFTFVASHDLKTPIRNIISFNKLLERRLGNAADDNTRQYLGFVRDYAYMMNNLVDNIISFSKIGQVEKEDISSVNLSEVSENVIQHLKPKIEARHADVHTEGGLPEVVANKKHVEELFSRLIDNALTYNDKAQPRITIGAIKNGKADRHLFVRDNGIGIDPNYQDKVFELFSKLHSSKDYQGSGMGLAICKKIVMQYGGRIWLESEKGVGTTVHVVLPAEVEN